jgi:hypothetical protein
LRLTRRARAMDATEDLSIGFHAMSDDPAVAVRANRCQRMDRAFEAIEDVMLAGNDHFKRFVIFIFANFTCSHTTSLSREATFSVVCFFVSNGP